MNATTEAITCPACKHEGPHDLQVSADLWRCCRCAWTFRVSDDGKAAPWLDVWKAGGKRKSRI